MAGLVSVVAVALGAKELHECHDSIHFGPENTLPISELDAHAILINSSANGALYRVNIPEYAGEQFSLLHVYGTPYEMGFAQGQLNGPRVKQMLSDTWTYFESQVTKALPSLPTWLADLIADVGLDVALDLTADATRLYTPSWFYDELTGMVAGAGGSRSDYNTAVRVHMIAGLTQGHCSLLGAWGAATIDGHVLQLRALDWDMDGPFRRHHQVTVYHPSDPAAIPHLSVGFEGFVGGLTGVNAQRVGISEIGVSFPDDSFGSQSRVGLPFIVVLRDIIMYDASFDAAVSRMASARRTCDLILGVGDAGAAGFNQVRGFEYSYDVLDVLGPENFRPANSTWHPPIADAVYWGMDWLCPAFNYVLGTQISKYRGQLDGPRVIRSVSGVQESGDLHIAVYDLTTLDVWVSFASALPSSSAPLGRGLRSPRNDSAYARQYTHLNATALFARAAGAATVV